MMEDEKGGDEKLLMVPLDSLHPYFTGVTAYQDLPKIVLEQIEHFFGHYKDLEAGKWVKILGWEGALKAEQLIMEAISRARGW
jgi:inorganic pyrophosphatase